MRILLSSLLLVCSLSAWAQASLVDKLQAMQVSDPTTVPEASLFSSVSADQLPAVIDKINGLTGPQMNLLTAAHFAAITDQAQFQRIGGNVFSAAAIKGLAALKTDQAATAGIGKLSVQQISAIAANQFSGLDAATLLKFSDSQLNALKGSQIANLPANLWDDTALKAKLDAIPVSQFSLMTPAEALAFKNNTNGAYLRLTPEQKAAVDAKASRTPTPQESSADSGTQDERPAVSSDAESANDYKATSCVWVKELPRRVVAVRGRLARTSCGTSGASNSCVGFVSCERRDSTQRLIRMSSCASNLCGEGDAVRCTQDRSRASITPSGEDNQTIKDNTTIRVQQQ